MSKQPKPDGHSLPPALRLHAWKQLNVPPPSNDMQRAALPKRSAGQLESVVQKSVQMLSPRAVMLRHWVAARHYAALVQVS